jgi:hypothetical protein
MAYLSAIVKLLGGWRAAGLAVVALLALSAAGVQTVRLSHSQASIAGFQRDAAQAAAYAAEQTTKASEAARKEEQTRARYIAGIDAAYQRGLKDAQAAGDRTAADLRTGVQRFRGLWAECTARSAAGSEVPGAAAGAGGADGASAGRADSAGRIVRAVESDAAKIRCLQALALTDRGQDPGDLANGCPVQADGQHASRPGH